MTDVNVATAFVTIAPSTKGFGRALGNDLDGIVPGVGHGAGKKMGGGFAAGLSTMARSAFAPLAVAGAGFAAVDFFSKAISGASDLVESSTKIQAVFGDASGAINDFASKGAAALGQSRLEVLNTAASFGVFGKAAGLTGPALSDFSSGLTTLSTDLASFFNSSPAEAAEAISSGLRGEAEPLRKYGVLLDDATLRNEALRLGLIKTTKDALTPQQKVLAAQAAIMNQTKDAQGDFARTSGGLANQQRILAAQWEDFTATIGKALLPAMTGLVTFMNTSVFPALSALGDAVGPVADKVGQGISGIVGLFKGDFNSDLGSAFGITEDSDVVGQIFNIRDSFISAFSEVGSFVKTEIVPRVTSIVDAIRGFVDVAMPIVRSFTDGMVERITPMMPTISGIFTTIGSIITGALDLVRAVIERVTAVISWVWDNFGEGIMNTVSTVFGVISGIIGAALNVVQAVISTVTAVINGDWSGAWDGFKNIISSAWEFIKTTIDGALTLIKTVLSSAWAAISSVASSAWNGLSSAIGGAISSLIDKVREIPGAVMGALRGAGSWLVDTGRNIVQGLIDGVRGMGGTLANAIVSLIPGPLQDVVRNALDIHSPSRVFMRIGQHTVEGLILGISNRSGDLESTMTDLAGIVNISGPAVSGMSNGYGATAHNTSNGGNVFHIYDVDGVLMGTMQGVVDSANSEQARNVRTGRR